MIIYPEHVSITPGFKRNVGGTTIKHCITFKTGKRWMQGRGILLAEEAIFKSLFFQRSQCEVETGSRNDGWDLLSGYNGTQMHCSFNMKGRSDMGIPKYITNLNLGDRSYYDAAVHALALIMIISEFFSYRKWSLNLISWWVYLELVSWGKNLVVFFFIS